LSDLRRIADISAELTEEEKSAVKEIVFTSALPPSRKSAGAKAEPGGDKQDLSGKDDATGSGRRKSHIQRTATMRFRAGAEVIKLLAEGANARMLAELHQRQARGSSDPASLGVEAAALNNSESAATISTVDSISAVPASAGVAQSEHGAALQRLHKVGSAVMELTEGKKGIASLLKKMNLQLGSNKSASLPAVQEEGGSPGGRQLGESDSVNSLGSGSSAVSGARAGISDMHNVVDAIFKKRPFSTASGQPQQHDAEPNLSLAPSFASLATVSSAASLRSEPTEFYRPPVNFSLSRFHDEAVRRGQEEQAKHQAAPQLLQSPPLSILTSEAELSDEGGEDVMLFSMRPAGQTHGAGGQTEASLPPAVRVLQQVGQHTSEGTSMLQLLRACVQDSETAAALPTPHAASMQPAHGLGFQALHAPAGRGPAEPAVERGGMLEVMRRRPKPDYQAEHESFF
jgi:hypothetical protein